MMKRGNLAIFVPHAGCPCRCSFCSQQEISGTEAMPDPDTVTVLCRQGAEQLSSDRKTEIAFFGGNFTAIDQKDMVALLEAAFPFVQSGAYSGIRISTRPDAIDTEVLALLTKYRVTAIELGAQSMEDSVLELNRRGHTAEQVVAAANMVRAAGFELGLQMMTGLYGADNTHDLRTAKRLIALAPDTVRVYPTIVLRGTYLNTLYEAGEYQPQTLEMATALCARLLALFEAAGVRVIRMGLHAQDTLEAQMTCGPYHPAFRELCEGRLMADRAAEVLIGRPTGEYQMRVAREGVSKIAGHGRYAVAHLERLGYNIRIITDAGLSGLEFQIEDV